MFGCLLLMVGVILSFIVGWISILSGCYVNGCIILSVVDFLGNNIVGVNCVFYLFLYE